MIVNHSGSIRATDWINKVFFLFSILYFRSCKSSHTHTPTHSKPLSFLLQPGIDPSLAVCVEGRYLTAELPGDCHDQSVIIVVIMEAVLSLFYLGSSLDHPSMDPNKAEVGIPSMHSALGSC